MQSNTLVIVRHSERLDEIDEKRWNSIVRTHVQRKGKRADSFANDPPLTTNGSTLAQTAAVTIHGRYQGINKIFSSKLLRAVATAYEIAIVKKLPIYLSSGLAQTAQAVEQSRGTFEFMSVDEIKDAFPGVDFVCCDSPDSEFHIPVHHWKRALDAIIAREPTAIVVAHRETIRNLAKTRLKTPYCCIGVFQASPVAVEGSAAAQAGSTTSAKHNYSMASLSDRDGRPVVT